jgi:4-amino-4-deoxychorismate lyase
MCQFIETIKVQNKELQNIEFHNLRFNKTQNDFFGSKEFLDLKQLIHVPLNLQNITYKCRVVYSTNIQKVEFLPYKIKPVSSLTIVTDNRIEYAYKFLDRTCFEKLLINIKTEDILIVKDGLISDTSFSNIAFYDGFKWLTPAKPLLHGTKLSLLLCNNQLHSEELKLKDLKKFKKAKLINAMLDFGEEDFIRMEKIYEL